MLIRIYFRISPAKDKLERRIQEGTAKNRNHLGRGAGSGPLRTRIVPACCPMWLYLL